MLNRAFLDIFLAHARCVEDERSELEDRFGEAESERCASICVRKVRKVYLLLLLLLGDLESWRFGGISWSLSCEWENETPNFLSIQWLEMV